MSIKKLLIVAGALALAACAPTGPNQVCALRDPEQHASDEYVCDQFPIVEEPQVEPAGDVQP